jgi:hypothetical protein
VVSSDSDGWIERFGGGPKKGPSNRVIDSAAPDQIPTSVVTVDELYTNSKAMRGGNTRRWRAWRPSATPSWSP